MTSTKTLMLAALVLLAAPAAASAQGRTFEAWFRVGASGSATPPAHGVRADRGNATPPAWGVRTRPSSAVIVRPTMPAPTPAVIVRPAHPLPSQPVIVRVAPPPPSAPVIVRAAPPAPSAPVIVRAQPPRVIVRAPAPAYAPPAPPAPGIVRAAPPPARVIVRAPSAPTATAYVTPASSAELCPTQARAVSYGASRTFTATASFRVGS